MSKFKENAKNIFSWCAKKIDSFFNFMKEFFSETFAWIGSEYKKHNRLFKRTYWCLGWLLWIFLFFSVLIELINGGSITYTIFRSGIAVSKFLNLDAIGKVCETIGISSILIVWLYSSLDKEEMGLKYIEILRFEHRYYYVYTLSHILSIVIAIWASKTNALEVGFIALLIVVWGCAMHSVFICKLLFNPNSKKRISKAIWQYRIDNPQNETDYIKHVYTLTDIVDIQENFNLDDTFDLIADALLKMPDKCKNVMGDNLYFYNLVWKNLLEKHNDEKRTIITKLLFVKMSTKDNFEEAKINVCAAYVLWLYNDILGKQYGEHRDNETLSNMLVRIDMLCLQINNKNTEQYLLAFFFSLMWLVFLNKKIKLNNYLLEKSNSFILDAISSSEMEQLIALFSTNLEMNDRSAIDITVAQICKN